MDGATWISISSIATSSGVAIAAVWLAARFAYRQAHIGRVWERKAEAYSEILEALHEIEQWFRAEMDDEYSRRDVSEDEQASRNAEYQDTRKRLRRRIAREVWLLPNETQQRIAAMNTEMSKRQDSWFEHLDNGAFEVRKAVEDISRLGGVDKFHSATAGGKNRQFEEARKRNIGNIARRADAAMAVFGPAPKGLPCKRPTLPAASRLARASCRATVALWNLSTPPSTGRAWWSEILMARTNAQFC